MDPVAQCHAVPRSETWDVTWTMRYLRQCSIAIGYRRVWIEMVTILMGKHAEVGMQQALDESHRNADDEDVISNQ